jgi:asparagine synthase (glutamine-hydrolysing)
MCGFGVHKEKYNDHFIRQRGQDAENHVEINGFTFSHYLLAVTGEPTKQPYIDGDIVCVYNGEIYNHSFEKSDWEVIIPLYKQYGADFPKHLDGEFAIALYDFEIDVCYFITDTFATKPLWVNGVECSSYESGVGGENIKPSTIIAKYIHGGRIIFDRTYHHFDFTNQHKDTYDDCIQAFRNSIRKRAKDRCFLGLSSGYDSGAIACELSNQKVNYKAYSVVASESKNILSLRGQLANEFELIHDFDHMEMKRHLNENAEEFFYDYYYNGDHITKSYKEDWAARGLSIICKQARNEGRKVYLSGQGADEILSDYSLIPRQSEFKGVFPERLSEWTNFYRGCQYSYLGKEECVAGSWNIETRYPFLDKDFVQEFLWLKPELKNRHYKAPIYEYLKLNNYPFEENKKIGFCA